MIVCRPNAPSLLPRLAALVAALALAGGVARADQASEALLKYQEPVDEAIDRALRFLAEHQEKDGFFESRHMRRNTAITSLCVMAFLAKGYTPGNEPYGDVIDRGIDAVLDSLQHNGMLVGSSRSHGPMYSHTISTLMLSEVSGMVSPERQRKLDEALAKALRVILAAQDVRKHRNHQGGWRYQHNSRDSDISCTGWAIMSLRSARNNGAAVPRDAIEDGIRFVLNCRRRDGGFGYQPGGGSGLARTGTALLCLELCGHHGKRETKDAGNWILGHLPRNRHENFFYYGIYYTSQGMFQLGEDFWETFGDHMYKLLLREQRDDGSWPEGDGNERRAGRCYSTAMAVLAMSVAYRQLPIYQR
ncbi:MAG: prenyltransferase/squalene oxidase repeat-containing protein [Candidatus Brocadiia bacterium]